MLHGLGQVARLARCVLQLGGEPGQPLGHGSVPPVEMRQLAGPLGGPGRRVPGTAPLRRQRLVDLDAATRDCLGMLGGGKSTANLGRLPFAEPRGGNLTGLVIVELEAAGQLVREHYIGELGLAVGALS